jgi:hypothetical protein
MNHRPLVAALMFSFVTRLFGQELATFTSPAGFYTVKYPSEWKTSREDNTVNIAPKDESGAVTISAYHGDVATREHAQQLIERVFKGYESVSRLQSTAHNDWTGISAEFHRSDSAGRRSWLVLAACRDKVLVLVTANDTEQAMQDRRITYQAILDSLVITDPDAKRQ